MKISILSSPFSPFLPARAGRFVLLKLGLACMASGLAPLPLRAAVYQVGPGQPLPSIGAVPWESLGPGDVVLIHWRPNAYNEKWVICRQGTENLPIVVRGVVGPNGELPVIDGRGATTRGILNYWNEGRGVIKVGGASNPPDTMPSHIRLENLEIRSGRSPYTFFSASGSQQTYTNNAAAIYVEKAENLLIRNCILRDSGNGLFIGSGQSFASRDVQIEGNYIFDNGIEGSIYQHNNYTAAQDIVFEFNRFGPLRDGCLGNNLKDRSAGLIVRYNWIEGGNRQLDLVDGEDSPLIRNDPDYATTHVYGNVLIETEGSGNRQIIHYGGDSGNTSAYRKGTLYLYHNTIVSYRSDRTTLVRLSTNEENCYLVNNIVYAQAGGATMALLDGSGTLDLKRNWLRPGWVSTFGVLTGTILDGTDLVAGESPGFVDEAGRDFRLLDSADSIDRATALPAAVMLSHPVEYQYVPHQSAVTRPASGTPDLGAYEFSATSPCDFNGDATADALDLQRLINTILLSVPLAGSDINRDGRTDVVDLQLLANVVLGVIACP